MNPVSLFGGTGFFVSKRTANSDIEDVETLKVNCEK